jgi:hypothetical protein
MASSVVGKRLCLHKTRFYAKNGPLQAHIVFLAFAKRFSSLQQGSRLTGTVLVLAEPIPSYENGVHLTRTLFVLAAGFSSYENDSRLTGKALHIYIAVTQIQFTGL